MANIKLTWTTIAGLLLWIVISFPAWRWLGARGVEGADVYINQIHGLGRWRLVGRVVGRNTTQYVSQYGLPKSLEEATEAGLFNIDASSDQWAWQVPRSYHPSKWKYEIAACSGCGDNGRVFRYDIPGCPTRVLCINEDGRVSYSLAGPWRPLMWWDVAAPYGIMVFLGLEVRAE